jgi:enoyl-CoA hydratase/carnithine racemase
MKETGRIGTKVEGAIGWIVFDRPEQNNALSLDMMESMVQALEAFAIDAVVRVVVLAGAGEKAFVAGADVTEIGEGSASAERQRHAGTIDRALSSLRQLRKPTLAMVQGYCLGAGLRVALNCDLRIAEQGAMLGIPAARLGIAYSYDGVTELVRLVGPAVAKEMLYTARRYNAAEALQRGLIHEVVAKTELEASTRSLAQTIAANAPLSVAAAKLAVDHAARREAAENHEEVRAAAAACFDSEDYREGRRALSEKRKPDFSGR